MRVTQNTLDRNLLQSMAQNLERLAQLNQQLSSGLRVNTISDDVPATGQILEMQRENERISTYMDNLTRANGVLSVATSNLSRVSETISSIRELGVQAATDTYTGANRQVMAEGVDSMLDTLISLANAQFNGQYVFSGEAINTAPFQPVTDASGRVTAVTYQGEPIATGAAVGPGIEAQVNLVGRAVFQQGADLFASVIALRDAISASDRDEIGRQLEQVNASHDRIRQNVGQLGEKQNQLQFMRTSLEGLQGFNAQLISDKQDADISQVSIEYNSTMTLLQMVMKVAAYAVKPSIFDFL